MSDTIPNQALPTKASASCLHDAPSTEYLLLQTRYQARELDRAVYLRPSMQLRLSIVPHLIQKWPILGASQVHLVRTVSLVVRLGDRLACRTHSSRYDVPPVQDPLVAASQNTRLSHAMWIPLVVRDGNINDTPPLQLLRKLVLWIDDSLACISRCGAHLGELRLGFGGDGEDFAALGSDIAAESLELAEVCLAEGAPGASVDCATWVSG